MTIREKNLLCFFLGVSKADNGCTKQYEKVLGNLSKLADKLGIKNGTPENKDFKELESEIIDLFEMTKDVYFSFGVNANEVIEEYDLDWTPKVMEEIATKEKAA